MAALGGLFASSPASGRDWRWIEKNVIDRVEVNGFRRLGYHIRSVQGDREAFNVSNYSGLGGQRFTDIGQLQITGRRVLGVLNFDATILDSRFTDPQGQKFSIDFDRDGWSVNLGDIQGSLLNTNRFANFSRSLRGAQIGYKTGRFEAKALTSQAKARAQTVTLNGNGSSGPYYLQSSQIVPESERVQVDGQLLQRGRDYVISYEVGALTFTTQAIPPSSTIAVTFEAFGANTRGGTIQGAAVAYNLGAAGRIGFTAMRQEAAGSTFGSTRLERFFGFGPPSVPYVLQFEPLSARPITIRVNGVLQVEGVDYTFDPDRPAVFFFTRFMPATDEIDVVYTPRPRQTVDGDREVVGLDYQVRLGKGVTLAYNQALGRLKNEVNPSSGLARGVTLDVVRGPWQFRANARDIPQGYVSVESLSFNRNERAHDFNLTYQPRSSLRLTASSGNSLVTTRRVTNNNAVVFDRSRVTSTALAYDLTPSETGQPVRVSWDRRQSRVAGNPSKADTLSLQTNRSFKALDYRLALSHTAGRGPTSFAVNSPLQNFTVTGATAGLSWRPSTALTLDVITSLNAVRSGDNDGVGRRQDLTLNYRPTEKLSVVGRYSDTDSGGVTGLGGFNDGSGVGLGGSGFSGTAPDSSFLGATGSRLASLGVEVRPSDVLAMSAEVFSNRFTGSVTSNSETTGVGFSVFWQMPQEQRLTLRLDQSRTTFVGSAQRSSATTLQASLDGKIGERFNYSIRGSSLLTGGTSAFRQNGITAEVLASYRLARRQNLLFEFTSGSTTGYLPQSDVAAGLVYQYQLIDSIALNVGYRLRDVRNRSNTVTSGAYRAGSFDLELSFSFPR